MVDKYPEDIYRRLDEVSSKMVKLENKNEELTSKNNELSNELEIVKNRQVTPIAKRG